MNQSGGTVIGILSGDRIEEAIEFRNSTGARFPLLLDDGRVAEAYGIVASPTMVRIAPGGTVLKP